MQKFVIKTLFRNLNHIKNKHLMKAFAMWTKLSLTTQKMPKTSSSKSSLKLFIHTRSKTQKQSPISSLNSSIESKVQSPGHRLYNQAQEIQNRKNEIRKSRMPEYTFIPTISSATQKWLKSKSKKQVKANEDVAVVSGNSLLAFPGQDLGQTKATLITSRMEKKHYSNKQL